MDTVKALVSDHAVREVQGVSGLLKCAAATSHETERHSDNPLLPFSACHAAIIRRGLFGAGGETACRRWKGPQEHRRKTKGHGQSQTLVFGMPPVRPWIAPRSANFAPNRKNRTFLRLFFFQKKKKEDRYACKIDPSLFSCSTRAGIVTDVPLLSFEKCFVTDVPPQARTHATCLGDTCTSRCTWTDKQMASAHMWRLTLWIPDLARKMLAPQRNAMKEYNLGPCGRQFGTPFTKQRHERVAFFFCFAGVVTETRRSRCFS